MRRHASPRVQHNHAREGKGCHWSSALPRMRDGIGTSATRAFRPLPDGTHALPRCCTQTEPPNWPCTVPQTLNTYGATGPRPRFLGATSAVDGSSAMGRAFEGTQGGRPVLDRPRHDAAFAVRLHAVEPTSPSLPFARDVRPHDVRPWAGLRARYGRPILLRYSWVAASKSRGSSGSCSSRRSRSTLAGRECSGRSSGGLGGGS